MHERPLRQGGRSLVHRLDLTPWRPELCHPLLRGLTLRRPTLKKVRSVGWSISGFQGVALMNVYCILRDTACAGPANAPDNEPPDIREHDDVGY